MTTTLVGVRALTVKRTGTPTPRFLCFNVASVCYLASSPAPVLACQPDEGTPALIVPSLLPLSTISTCLCSSQQEQGKGSQPVVLTAQLWLMGAGRRLLAAVGWRQYTAGHSSLPGRKPERNCFLLFGNYKMQVILGSEGSPAFQVGSMYFQILTITAVSTGRETSQLRSFLNPHERG